MSKDSEIKKVDDLLNKVKNKCGIICINMVLLFVI